MAVHDPAARRQGVRKGRERGAWVYVTGEQLATMGFDTKAPPPFYRSWTRRKTILVQFYLEP